MRNSIAYLEYAIRFNLAPTGKPLLAFCQKWSFLHLEAAILAKGAAMGAASRASPVTVLPRTVGAEF